jgi:superfamily II DNA or RNA helicase
MRFRPESYWRSEAYQLFKISNGERGWDGYAYPLKGLNVRPKPNDVAEANRGHLDTIVGLAKAFGIQLDLSKLLPRPFHDLVPDDLPDDLIEADFELDEGQRRCITSWLVHTMGVQHIAVNGGKTACFAAVAEMIKRKYPTARVLYTTQTERLVRQAYRDMCGFLPGWDISQFGGGKKNREGRDMVISTNAIIGRNFKILKGEKWFKSFMVVLFDESHHASSPTCQKFLPEIPAFFRLGASDSMKEGDEGRSVTITGLVGPRRDEIRDLELIEAGRSAKPYIYLVDVQEWTDKFKDYGHVAKPDSNAWCLLDGKWVRGVYVGPVYERIKQGEPGLAVEGDGFRRDRKGNLITVPNMHKVLLGEEEHELSSRWCLLDRLYDRGIIRFKERNELGALWVEHYVKQGFPTLVVATRTLHILILESVIKKRVGADRVRILYSEHSTRERDETFQWFRETEGGVLITSLVKEGVSINEIRAGVIMDHVVDWEVFKQILGRFVRKKEGDNVAHITAFLDRQNALLRRNGIKLFRQLEHIRGYVFKHPVITPETIGTALEYDSAKVG